MTDPYAILGVSPNASDDEVKNAYRKLAKKYHPDNYAESPLSDVASEKMKEINQAYETIQSQRKGGGNANGYGQGGAYGGSAYNNAYRWNGGNTANSKYRDVRMLIQHGRIADADQILSGVPAEKRDAEWQFLKGTVLFRRGWTNEAYTHFQTACNMDPTNAEYRMAFNQMNQRRSGAYGGYNTTTSNSDGCSGCNICAALCCADSCCECMGGDLIPCC